MADAGAKPSGLYQSFQSRGIGRRELWQSLPVASKLFSILLVADVLLCLATLVYQLHQASSRCEGARGRVRSPARGAGRPIATGELTASPSARSRRRGGDHLPPRGRAAGIAAANARARRRAPNAPTPRAA
jgi:hypothetical protein